MIGYTNVENPGDFFMASGILFLLLVVGFICVVIVLKDLYRRVSAAGRVDSIRTRMVPGWVAAAVGGLCVAGGIGGVWVGIVPGIIEQTFFTITYPDTDFLVFQPLGYASVIFGTLLTLFGVCILMLGLFLLMEFWLHRK